MNLEVRAFRTRDFVLSAMVFQDYLSDWQLEPNERTVQARMPKLSLMLSLL